MSPQSVKHDNFLTNPMWALEELQASDHDDGATRDAHYRHLACIATTEEIAQPSLVPCLNYGKIYNELSAMGFGDVNSGGKKQRQQREEEEEDNGHQQSLMPGMMSNEEPYDVNEEILAPLSPLSLNDASDQSPNNELRTLGLFSPVSTTTTTATTSSTPAQTLTSSGVSVLLPNSSVATRTVRRTHDPANDFDDAFWEFLVYMGYGDCKKFNKFVQEAEFSDNIIESIKDARRRCQNRDSKQKERQRNSAQDNSTDPDQRRKRPRRQQVIADDSGL